jgi:hypothetical protein
MGSITEIESVSIYRLDHERILEQQEKLWLLGPAILMIHVGTSLWLAGRPDASQPAASQMNDYAVST